MKNALFIITLFCSIFTFGQKIEDISLIKADSTWGKEIIKFPIEWAPNLKVKGFEELLFSPKWSDPKSDQFWSLVIAWNIETETPLTLKEIENNFKGYFDGLMKPNHWATEFPNPAVNFTKKLNNNFNGKMTLFDGFHTGKIINLNIKAEHHFCEKTKKMILVFLISPKEFKNKIWKTLNEVQLKKDFCN